MPDLEERFTVHDGRRLRYLTGGNGSPMLLCHGFIGSAENFQDWLSALLPRRTLVIPDLPGFGRSNSLDGPHDADTLAGAALTATRDAGIDRYDVAGLCLGASVALAVERAQPARVDKLVLHTPLLAPWLTRLRFHAQAGIMLAPGIFSGIVWLSRRRVVSDLYKRLIIEGGNVDPAAAQVNFDNQVRAHTRAAREWLRDGLRRQDLAQLLRRRRSSLVIVAAGDSIIDVPRLRRALGGVPHVELAIMHEGGHAWTASMIDHQCRALAAFLDDRPLPDTAAAA